LTEEITAATATSTTYLATVSAGYGVLTYNEILMTVSVGVAVLSAGVNLYYRRKMLQEVRKKNET